MALKIEFDAQVWHVLANTAEHNQHVLHTSEMCQLKKVFDFM